MLATLGVSVPSQRRESEGDGDLPSNASAARGRSIPLPIAPAQAASNDLRVIGRALIVIYDTTIRHGLRLGSMRIR
jgi:hypothetical protein